MKLVPKGLVGLGMVALAAAPLALSATTSGAQAVEPIVVQFTTPGSSDFTVPDDVRCLEIDAIGAGGGNGVGTPATPGLGGEVSGSFQVLPGQVLQVNVGGVGGDGSGATGGAGGFNGGGAGGTTTDSGGGGGGGASDVRQGGTGLAERMLAAGGGGGTSSFNSNSPDGGDGGDPGEAGGDGNSATGGGGGTDVAGGAGGVSGTDPGLADGQPGALGQGGAGGGGTGGDPEAPIDAGAGGGGGGYYGGGGGGGTSAGIPGAGGGGSNFVAGDGMTGDTGVNAGDGQVTISYQPGDTSCVLAPLTITKTIAGAPLPAAGTSFSIHVACDESNIDLGSLGLPGESDQATIDFVVGSDGTAQPVGSDTLSFSGPTQCTVTEPGAGGAASSSFTCEGVEGAPLSSTAAARSWGEVGASAVVTPDSPVCPAPGPSDGSILVNIVWPDQTATVNVTNTFAAAAAAVTPRFTG